MKSRLLLSLIIVSATFIVAETTYAGDPLRRADELWQEGKVVEAAKEVYPLANDSNSLARLKLSFYAMIIRQQKLDIPELPDWEIKARRWLLELVRNDQEPEVAAGAAELLIGAVDGSMLGFQKSNERVQCWRNVFHCWADVIEQKKHDAKSCIYASEKAQAC